LRLECNKTFLQQQQNWAQLRSPKGCLFFETGTQDAKKLCCCKNVLGLEFEVFDVQQSKYKNFQPFRKIQWGGVFTFFDYLISPKVNFQKNRALSAWKFFCPHMLRFFLDLTRFQEVLLHLWERDEAQVSLKLGQFFVFFFGSKSEGKMSFRFGKRVELLSPNSFQPVFSLACNTHLATVGR
jgi:hypothetical protein